MTGRRLALLALVLAAPGCAGPTARWNPDVWARNITPADVRSHYPAPALTAGTSGVVQLRCRTTLSGEMTACQVMTETPPEQGFGEAALEMTTVMVMKTDAPGFRVGRLVQFDVRFNPATGKHSSQRPVQAGPVKLATDKPTPE